MRTNAADDRAGDELAIIAAARGTAPGSAQRRDLIFDAPESLQALQSASDELSLLRGRPARKALNAKTRLSG
jgi:hypothetical protein